MRILLAIDNSEFAKQAVHVVAQQCRPRGTRIEVLHVVEAVMAYVSAELVPHLVSHIEQVEKDRQREGNQLVKEASAKLRKAGFSTTTLVVDGDPRTQILNRAVAWNADLIVVGSHGLRGLNRLLMGSVSEAVSRHAPCSVEIVRIKRILKRPRPRSRRAATHS
jgi:nucleotide-binding universal stress UspA family protein